MPDNSLWGKGANSAHQLGIETDSDSVASFMLLMANVKKVVAGQSGTMALGLSGRH